MFYIKLSMYERQRPECRDYREFVRPPRRPNPVVDGGVKELWWKFIGVSAELHNQEDRDNISTNASLLSACLDIQTDLSHKGTHTELDNGVIICKQELFTTDIFVDLQTGKILDFNHNEVDLEVAYGENTARLELEVLIDYDEFVRGEPGYQQYQFAIRCPEDPKTGVPFPLAVQLSERAIRVIEATEQICNDPTA